MTAPTVSEEEFIALFKKFGSPTKVARYLGISVRNVHARRDRLSKILGIDLHTCYKPGGMPIDGAKKDAIRETTIQNGTVLVFSDAHYFPDIISPGHRALIEMIHRLKPAIIVCNGDAFDGGTISRFPRIGWESKPSVKHELAAVTERLDEIEQAVKKIRRGTKLYWPLGNHDARYETFLAQNAPQYEGVSGFHLKDKFPNWIPCWALKINDDVVVKHRMKGGVHSGHNNALWSGRTMVTGHDHMLKITPLVDYNGIRWGVNTGTLATPYGPQFIDYTEGNVTNWASGFAVLTFRDGRLMWPELVSVISDNEVCFRGEIIKV